MKTTLFTVALLFASHFSNAQRIHETTQGSWDFPNLSVETYKDFVISGFTERGQTGYLNPTFKISDINGSPVTAFNIDYFGDDIYLMDFTIRDKAHSIIFTGITAALGGGIHKMIVAEVDLMTGTPIQSTVQYDVNGGGSSLIPHQVIHSEPNNQVVIVGSEIDGPLDPSNFAFLPKTGFVLGLDINNYTTTAFTTVEMDSWSSSNWDYDMLENVTEVPGYGYFISGASNDPSGSGNQTVHTMAVNYGGTVMFSNIIDNSNFRFTGSSVMYNAPLDVVYLMVNNSALHQFQLAICNPYTGGFSNWVSHQITSLPVPIGSGIDQNGFRLQQSVENLIVVGGYLSAPGGALPAQLTPFQITMRDDLKFAAAKVYQSDNNNPLDPSYFEENGNSVFINTPDMIVYNRYSKRTYLVNQNKNYAGFDLNVSSLLKPSKCEKAHQVMTFHIPPNFVGHANKHVMDVQGVTYMPNPLPRPIIEHILCQEVAPLPIITNPNPATLSPNPASVELRIALDEEMIQDVLVYDMKGNVVLREKATERSRNVMNLNIGKLNQGAYILEITTEEGTIHHEKFVKE